MNSQSSQNYQSFNDALSNAPQHNAIAQHLFFLTLAEKQTPLQRNDPKCAWNRREGNRET